MDYYKFCTLCPRNCKINRYEKLGYCKASNEIKIAKADLFFFEEPPISNDKGSGAIFFSNCNMGCIFCQNYDISALNYGKIVSMEKLSNIMISLQNKGALNINLVTPTMYVPGIIESIKMAKENGLNIPIIYNTSSYENIDTIKLLDGNIDVYLPDLKYFDDDIAFKYSKCKDYFKYASTAIDAMYKQVGKCVFDDNGNIVKGLIVRHLMLPGHINDSKKIIKYLYDTYKDNIYISIMNQYTPIRHLEYENLNRTITDKEYDELINYAYDLGIRNAFVQIGETQKTSFIPDFKNQDF